MPSFHKLYSHLMHEDNETPFSYTYYCRIVNELKQHLHTYRHLKCLLTYNQRIGTDNMTQFIKLLMIYILRQTGKKMKDIVH